MENEIQRRLAKKEGFDISFFDLEEAYFYDEESGYDTRDQDCPRHINDQWHANIVEPDDNEQKAFQHLDVISRDFD